MSYLTDTEKRLLFSALHREKEVCQKIDDTKVEDATCKMLVPIVNSLEKKFYYDKFEKEIRDNAIEEFIEAEDYLMKKIKEETAEVNIDFEWRKAVCLDDIRTKLHEGLSEIAEQMKEVGE